MRRPARMGQGRRSHETATRVPDGSSHGARLPALHTGHRAGDHRHHRGHRFRFERRRARRLDHHQGSQPRNVGYVGHRRERHLHGALSHARHLLRRGQCPRIQEVGAHRRRVAGQPARPRRRHARSRRHRRNHHGRCVSPAAADRFVGSRHRHRGAGDQRAPAQRPELCDARLSDAGGHTRTSGREPLRREHLQSARRLELQRPRPSGQRQRLADRRHRQQRVFLQHRDHRPLRRAGARIQGAVGRILSGVRARRRRRLRRDQVRQQRPARDRFRVPARRRLRCAELLRAKSHAPRRQPPGRSQTAAEPSSVRRRGGRRAGGTGSL